MLGEFTLPVWTLFVFVLGYFFGYAANNTSDGEDDSPGAATADDLEQ